MNPVAVGCVEIALAYVRAAARPASAPHTIALYTMVISIVLRAATEVVQLFTDRGASLVDVGRDAVGVCAALQCWLAMRSRTSCVRWPALALSARAALLGVGLRAPVRYACGWVLADVLVDSPASSRYVVIAEGDREPVVQGDHPGFRLVDPVPEWSGQRTLRVTLRNPDEKALPNVVSVHDRAHDWTHGDRYISCFAIPGGARTTLDIPLATVAVAPRSRRLDLA